MIGSLWQQVQPWPSGAPERHWHYFRLLEHVAITGDVDSWRLEDLADGHHVVADDRDLAGSFERVPS